MVVSGREAGRGTSGRPDDLHVIRLESLVGGQQVESLGLALRHQQPVEWVPVVRR